MVIGSALLILNSLALIIIYNYTEKKNHFAELESDGVSIAAAIADANKYGVITRNREVLNAGIGGMLKHDILSIDILDEAGNTLAEAVNSHAVKSAAAGRLKSINRPAGVPDVEKVFGSDGLLDLVIIRAAIQLETRSMREEIGLFIGAAGTERIGTAVVVMDAREVYRELEKSRRGFIFSAIFIVLVGLPLIVLFVEVTAGPLKKLVTATQRVAEGDLGYKVEVTSTDEIGVLAESFNTMTERLKTAQDKMVAAERFEASSRLAADMAHEINNPLSIIKSYISLMKVKRLRQDDPAQKTLTVIDGEIDRITRIITQYNDFYRSAQIPLEEIDILDPVKDVINFYRGRLEGKGFVLDVRLTDSGRVLANMDKLKQVFLNLIKNAEEAMGEGGRIAIESSRTDGKIMISVSDTGIGIPEEHLKKIFDPFFSTKGSKGTGLGLSVTNGLIKGFNGQIEVESEVSKGTTFRVTLPAI